MLDAAGTLHAPAVRVPTPYPLPPERLVETIADDRRRPAARRPRHRRHARDDPARRRRRDPALRHPLRARARAVDPELVAAWAGLRRPRGASRRGSACPTLVLNDAEVHGAGVVSGTGVELVLTLGTGLGSALFDGGRPRPAPRAARTRPVRWGTTYDAYIGQLERARLGDGAVVAAGPPRRRRAPARVPLGPALPRRRQRPADHPGRRSRGSATTSSSCPTRPASSAASGRGRWALTRQPAVAHTSPRPWAGGRVPEPDLAPLHPSRRTRHRGRGHADHDQDTRDGLPRPHLLTDGLPACLRASTSSTASSSTRVNRAGRDEAHQVRRAAAPRPADRRGTRAGTGAPRRGSGRTRR